MGRHVKPSRHTDKQGEAFYIREAHPGDARQVMDTVHATLADAPRTMISTPSEFNFTLDQEKTLLRNYQRSDTETMLIAVRGCMRGRVVGVLNGRIKGRARLNHNLNIGIHVVQAERGRGVGRALMERVIEYTLEHPTLRKLSLTVLATNEPAIALYRSLGFIEEGRRHNEVCYADIDGQFVDDIMMYMWFDPPKPAS